MALVECSREEVEEVGEVGEEEVGEVGEEENCSLVNCSSLVSCRRRGDPYFAMLPFSPRHRDLR